MIVKDARARGASARASARVRTRALAERRHRRDGGRDDERGHEDHSVGTTAHGARARGGWEGVSACAASLCARARRAVCVQRSTAIDRRQARRRVSPLQTRGRAAAAARGVRVPRGLQCACGGGGRVSVSACLALRERAAISAPPRTMAAPPDRARAGTSRVPHRKFAPCRFGAPRGARARAVPVPAPFFRDFAPRGARPSPRARGRWLYRQIGRVPAPFRGAPGHSRHAGLGRGGGRERARFLKPCRLAPLIFIYMIGSI